jgi:hypothetical protein
MTTPLNQNRADFKAWLESLPPEEEAIACDCNECWLAKWFESQGFYVYGVFPTYMSEHPNSVLIEDPEHEDFTPEDDITLEDWAYLFGSSFDEKYSGGFRECGTCNRDQALELLEEIK